MYITQIKSIPKIRWVMLFVISLLFAIIQLHTTNDWQTLKIDDLLYYFAPTDQSSTIAEDYLYALPLIAMILSGGLWPKEKNSHRLIYDYSRVNHQSLIRVTMINNFLLGGLSVILPLLFNLMFALTKCHHFNSSVALSGGWGFNVTGKFWAGNLFDQQPIYALLLILVIYFIYGGIFACLGMLSSFYFRYKYSEYLMPFLLNFIYILFTSLIGMEDWNLVFYLYMPTASNTSMTGISLLSVTLVLLVGIGIGYRKMVSSDVLE